MQHPVVCNAKPDATRRAYYQCNVRCDTLSPVMQNPMRHVALSTTGSDATLLRPSLRLFILDHVPLRGVPPVAVGSVMRARSPLLLVSRQLRCHSDATLSRPPMHGAIQHPCSYTANHCHLTVRTAAAAGLCCGPPTHCVISPRYTPALYRLPPHPDY